MLRQARPDIARRYYKGILWSPSYFAASTGGATLETIKRYVEAQRSAPPPRPKGRGFRRGNYDELSQPGQEECRFNPHRLSPISEMANGNRNGPKARAPHMHSRRETPATSLACCGSRSRPFEKPTGGRKRRTSRITNASTACPFWKRSAAGPGKRNARVSEPALRYSGKNVARGGGGEK